MMIQNMEEDNWPDWHEMMLLMWYNDILPLSRTTLAALFIIGMV